MHRCALLFLFLSASLQGTPLQFSVGAEEAILMNAKTGRVLWEKNAKIPTAPASTTKIGTVLFTLHKYRSQLEKTVTAEREALASITPQAKRQSNYRSPAYWLETDGTHIGIKRGEEFRVSDLLYGALLASANDACNVLALSLGESIPKFVEEMNTYLKTLGCLNTHFANPHGLHHPDHFTSAYDLALMAKEGMKDPFFRQIVSTVRYVCPQTNLELERTLSQGNQLLRNGPHFYPKAIGVKTGYTQAAGKNLVAAAQDKERELIVVVLGYRGLRAELYQDVIKMFEGAFNEPKMRRTLLLKGEQKFTCKIAGAKGVLKTLLPENLDYRFYPSEEVAVKATVVWEIPPLPIASGAQVGKIRLVDEGGKLVQEKPLLASHPVQATLWHRLNGVLSHNKLGRKLAFGAGACLLLLFLWNLRQKKSLRRS